MKKIFNRNTWLKLRYIAQQLWKIIKKIEFLHIVNKILKITREIIIILFILSLIFATLGILVNLFFDKITIFDDCCNSFFIVNTNPNAITILSVLVAISALATPVIAYIHSNKLDDKSDNIKHEVLQDSQKLITNIKESLQQETVEYIQNIPKILSLIAKFDYQYRQDLVNTGLSSYNVLEINTILIDFIYIQEDAQDNIYNLSSKIHKTLREEYIKDNQATNTKSIQYFIDVLVALYQFGSFEGNANKLALKQTLNNMGISSIFWEKIHS